MMAEMSVTQLHMLYLGFDGSRHPEGVYRTPNGIELLRHPRYSLFEHVPLLEEVLAPYPDVPDCPIDVVATA
ncbi:hypothetical protein SAMN05216345_102683 [Cupriavidus sp. YR651]|nr:hypothetical protein SAMN05216345_102683 [Cupriavidus sp. YR651]